MLTVRDACGRPVAESHWSDSDKRHFWAERARAARTAIERGYTHLAEAATDALLYEALLNDLNTSKEVAYVHAA